MSVPIGQLLKPVGEILKWIWRNPAARNAVVRGVTRDLLPAVRRDLDNYRKAVAEKERKERERRVNELRGQVAIYTVDECLQFLDMLKTEPDNEVRGEIIELVADRLKALKGGR